MYKLLFGQTKKIECTTCKKIIKVSKYANGCNFYCSSVCYYANDKSLSKN